MIAKQVIAKLRSVWRGCEDRPWPQVKAHMLDVAGLVQARGAFGEAFDMVF